MMAFSKSRCEFGDAAPHVYEAVRAYVAKFARAGIEVSAEEACVELYGKDVRVGG